MNSSSKPLPRSLKLLHGSDICRLDVVLELLDLLLELGQADLLVLDDEVDMQLVESSSAGLEAARKHGPICIIMLLSLGIGEKNRKQTGTYLTM
jgi:hypothetical protein